MKHPWQVIYEIDKPFGVLWDESKVEETYLDWVNERIDELIENLYTYDPYQIAETEYKASVEMLAYTTTELLAQFCAGGFRWVSDKARFLSPTVHLEGIVRDRVREDRGYLGDYNDSIRSGVWGFLAVSDDTKSWLEAQGLNKQQVSYLLWSAKRALSLLKSDERIPGFTDLALSDDEVLGGFCKCESPIESILYMQLVMDGLRPPELQNQWHIEPYRVDFAIPSGNIVIECDGKKYHQDFMIDVLRDMKLAEAGWTVIHFPSQDILKNSRVCSSRVHSVYPWTEQT